MGERWCSEPGCLAPPARGSVFCRACTARIDATHKSTRQLCRPMQSGEKGSDPIAPESWRVDLAEPAGHVVYGYLAPELEDVPPWCTADDARGLR